MYVFGTMFSIERERGLSDLEKNHIFRLLVLGSVRWYIKTYRNCQGCLFAVEMFLVQSVQEVQAKSLVGCALILILTDFCVFSKDRDRVNDDTCVYVTHLRTESNHGPTIGGAFDVTAQEVFARFKRHSIEHHVHWCASHDGTIFVSSRATTCEETLLRDLRKTMSSTEKMESDVNITTDRFPTCQPNVDVCLMGLCQAIELCVSDGMSQDWTALSLLLVMVFLHYCARLVM